MNETCAFPCTFPLSYAAFSQGLALGLALIMAIGAQNAFVLRQGLKREHVTLIVLCCALADALLMAAGVYGLAALVGERPWLATALTAGGALFLTAYGLQALRRALKPDSLQAGSGPGLSRRQALLQLAGFTLLNPHVYLDTVVLVGSLGAKHLGLAKLAFVGGAASGSLLWFAALGFGARWLAPWFARPRAWACLDLGVGLTMLGLAAMLARELLSIPRP